MQTRLLQFILLRLVQFVVQPLESLRRPNPRFEIVVTERRLQRLEAVVLGLRMKAQPAPLIESCIF